MIKIMNKDLLQKHIQNYHEEKDTNPDQFQEYWAQRQEHIIQYRASN